MRYSTSSKSTRQLVHPKSVGPLNAHRSSPHNATCNEERKPLRHKDLLLNGAIDLVASRFCHWFSVKLRLGLHIGHECGIAGNVKDLFTWRIPGSPFSGGGLALIPNRLREVHKTCNCVLTGICEERVHWALRIFVPIRRPHELSIHSSIFGR